LAGWAAIYPYRCQGCGHRYLRFRYGNLPGLGATLNKVRIRGMSPQRVGWTGRVPAALSWERSYFALRKRVK